MNIHKRALEVLGLRLRLQKLRTEATELANAIDRYEEGKGTIEDIYHEIMDVDFIRRSIILHDNEKYYALEAEHEVHAYRKLLKAIDDYNNFLFNS
jgi:hypothetical protein